MLLDESAELLSMELQKISTVAERNSVKPLSIKMNHQPSIKENGINA